MLKFRVTHDFNIAEYEYDKQIALSPTFFKGQGIELN